MRVCLSPPRDTDEEIELEPVPAIDPIMEALTNQVFGNDLLLEIILTKVVMQIRENDLCGKPSVNWSDVHSLRLVNKQWYSGVSSIFKKLQKPLYALTAMHIRTGPTYNPDIADDDPLELTQFVSAMDDANRLSIIPPFRLTLKPCFFRCENYTDLRNCFVKCGCSLVNLSLSFPINSTMTFVFPYFYLPNLSKLAIHFSDERLPNDSGGLQNNAHTVYPLQSIFNATNKLRELHFMYTPTPELIPFGFEYLTLPSTITKLFIDCPMKDSDLELIVKNPLTSLTELRLFAPEIAYRDGLIYKVLCSVRHTLQGLHLRGRRPLGGYRNSSITFFKLPLMENLTTLTSLSLCWELEETEDQPTAYESLLPKLTELRILNQTTSLVQKWTAGSKFGTVSRLDVSVVITRNHPAHAQYQHYMNIQHADLPVSIPALIMQSITLAFPNVTCLEVTVAGPETTGLQYLFLEMKHLLKLAITVKGNAELIKPPFWDALLIGAPKDLTSSLRNNRDFWNNVEFNDNSTSIRKLTELRWLAIVENQLLSQIGIPGETLISDVTFHFSLLRMPNLKHLLLSPRFMPSVQMVQRWKKEKGTDIRSILT